MQLQNSVGKIHLRPIFRLADGNRLLKIITFRFQKMKNWIFVSFFALASTASFGQTINFSAAAGIFDIDCTTPVSAAKGEWEVVYNGAIITPNGDNGVPFSKTGAPQLNTVFGGTIFAFPSSTGLTAGSTPTITINVWDKTTGATYSTASHFASETITLPPLGAVGSSTPPPSLPFTRLSFAICPEPSTYALAALGFGGLFFVNRPK